MFVLPSVFPGPVVTKGRFPSVTAELSQARVHLAPVREAWGTLQGPATGRGPCPQGARLLPLPCLGTCGLVSWHFPQALARNIPEPRILRRRLGVRRPLAGGPWGVGLRRDHGPQPGCCLGPWGTLTLGSGRTRWPEVVLGEIFQEEERHEETAWVGEAGRGSFTAERARQMNALGSGQVLVRLVCRTAYDSVTARLLEMARLAWPAGKSGSRESCGELVGALRGQGSPHPTVSRGGACR